MAVQSTQSVQEEIIAALLKDSYLFSMCKEQMNDGYFSDGACKVIYKALATYYNKYSSIPTLNEMLITIEDCYSIVSGVTLADVKDMAQRLYDRPMPDESFIMNKITEFIRKTRAYGVFKNVVDKAKENQNFFDNDTELTNMLKTLDVSLSTTQMFMMNNIDQVREARLAAIGDGQSKIIRSFIPSINQCLMFGGWQPSTVNMIVSPPGCFTADTKLLLADGSTAKLGDLAIGKVSPTVIGSSPREYALENGTADSVVMTKTVDELCDVEINNIYHVKCTVDHPFMLMDGTFVEARHLTEGTQLRGTYNSGTDVHTHPYLKQTQVLSYYTVTKVNHLMLNYSTPVYGVVDAKPFGNYAIALDDNHGLFVHNTGKSMFLINEGAYAAKQGFKVLHVFIGDMVEYDGFIRYLSCLSCMEQSALIRLNEEKQQEVINFCNQQYNDVFTRIGILAYPSQTITVDALMEDISKLESRHNLDFDMIIVDYPDNLLQEGKSLYEDGGTLYSSLERMARLSKSVVLVASQPGKFYWNHSIIPLEAAAESSKKQQCVDVMITFNTETRGAPIGTMLLAKARKGEVGKIFRVKTDFSKCQMAEIDEGTFNAMKAQLLPNSVDNKNG